MQVILRDIEQANFPLPSELDLDTAARPVVARFTECPEAGFRVRVHVHTRSQLAFAASGTITVATEQGVWVVPSHRAVWIPAGIQHRIESTEKVSMCSVFVDPAIRSLFDRCCVVPVTPLLRELILHAVRLPNVYEVGSAGERVMLVLLDQLQAIQSQSLHLPMPTDRRLLKIARALLKDPADKRNLSDWAKEVGAGERTLSRLFPAETGMNFRCWQQQVRLLEALRLLAMGNPVTTVAIDVGYDSVSAFIGMFKRALGKTPGEYFNN